MKTRKSILLSLVLFAFVSSTAIANDSFVKEPESVNEQLYDMLKSVQFEIEDNDIIYIDFMLNDRAEIIVLSTSHKNLDKTLKAVLNYKTLETSELEFNRKYTVPVKFSKK